MTEIVGFDSEDEFQAAVAKWDAEHAGEPSPMLADAEWIARRDVTVAATLENLAHAVRVGGLDSVAWSVDCPYECADSVCMETGARQIDATVAAEMILVALRTLADEWPNT